MRHLDHLLDVAGPDHVGIGSDFDGGIIPPAGIDSCADLPHVLEALAGRGHPASTIEKVAGGNFLRVFEAVRG